MSDNANYPVVKSQKVWILRVKTEPPIPEIGVLVSSIVDSVMKIGPSFEGGQSRRPKGRVALTVEEEARLMPALVGVQPNHPEWDKRLDDYWHSISVNVPYTGLELEVGMRYTSADDLGTPINLAQYVLYRYCLVYRHVANSKADASKAPHIRFYIYSKEEEVKQRQASRSVKDTAFSTRISVQGDDKKVRAIITLFNLQPPEDPNERFLALCELSENDPARFITIATDENLLLKSFIERCITVGVLVRPLNTTLILYNDSTIGHNMEEAVAFLKDASNNQTLQTLQVKLKDSKK